MNIAIKAENLGKRYYLNQTVGLRLRQAVGRLIGKQVPSKQDFWALKDINFTIREGESVGIIGPNGAGKSTLLKILSNVTKATTGSLNIHGQVGALIEVGAGFHSELSGRENIFLNGSILGMKKRDIVARFDEIVAFADIEKFIDTPVKRYSSGMFVRLGFSIAAHINPDILMVDEILAVGDLSFQKKCFEWVHRYLRSGKTFLLVSHHMHHIENVCKRALYINGGRIVFDGSPDQAISLYLGDLSDGNASAGPVGFRGRRTRVGEFDVPEVYLLNSNDMPTEMITLDQPLTVRIDFRAPAKIPRPKIEVAFNHDGMRVGQANTISDGVAPEILKGEGSITFRWPRCFLTPNPYTIDIFVSDGSTGADVFVWNNALAFKVTAPEGFRMASGKPGMVRIPGDWSFQIN